MSTSVTLIGLRAISVEQFYWLNNPIRLSVAIHCLLLRRYSMSAQFRSLMSSLTTLLSQMLINIEHCYLVGLSFCQTSGRYRACEIGCGRAACLLKG